MSAPLLGRPEAAMLLAVEGANGGELSGLEQVLVAFETLFQRSMQPEAYARSCALLCEAQLVEWVDDSLGLTPGGRKLLRRTGVPGNPERPVQVADQLSLLEEVDLEPPGSVPAPDARAFEAATKSLASDGEQGDEPVLGSDLAPQPPDNLGPWPMRQTPAFSRLVLPRFHRHHDMPPAPLVAPLEAEGDQGDPPEH